MALAVGPGSKGKKQASIINERIVETSECVFKENLFRFIGRDFITKFEPDKVTNGIYSTGVGDGKWRLVNGKW